VPALQAIVTHIEPVGDVEALRPAVSADSERVEREILDLPRLVPEVKDCHHIALHREGNELAVSFHARVDRDLPIRRAHVLTVRLESVLRSRLPELGRVVIHLEPLKPDSPETPPPAGP
jgi:divalent metal cation (Fe/Co/Zn/Cd) transporter